MTRAPIFKLPRRRFLASASAIGGAALLGLHASARSADPPPETNRIRLLHVPAICHAPMYLAEEMLHLEGITEVEYVARAVKRIAKIAGEDPRQFSAHSARAGMLTTASEANVGLDAIMRQSGHASTNVAMGYIRPTEQARNPAARAVVDRLGDDET